MNQAKKMWTSVLSEETVQKPWGAWDPHRAQLFFRKGGTIWLSNSTPRVRPREVRTVSRSDVFCMSVPSCTVQTAGRWDHPTSITAAHRTNPGRSVQGNAVQHEEEKVLLPAPRQVSLAHRLLSGRARRKRPQVVCFHLHEVSWGGKCLEAGSQWPLAGVWEEQQWGGSARGYTASFCGDVTVKVDNGAGCTILAPIKTTESFTIKGWLLWDVDSFSINLLFQK